MDRSQVKAIVEFHLMPLARFLCVSHWSYTVSYGPCDNKNWDAQCERSTNYDKATIIIDPEKAEDEDAVLDSLFHELCHVVLAPLDIYRQVMAQHIEQGSTADHQEDVIWRYHIEQAVINLERIWRISMRFNYLDSVTGPTGSKT